MPFFFDRNLRLLIIAPWNYLPAMDPILLGHLPGFERISVSTDCDDGLRLALMIDPDVILLPWRASMRKLLSALIHLRGKRSTPLIAVVADAASPQDDLPDPKVLMIKAEQLNDEEFTSHILRSAIIVADEI